MTTHKVTLKPSGEVIEVDASRPLLESLREQNIYIKSSCGGVATCSDCICKVVSGEDNLESPPFAELKLLGNVFHITKERLLCQTKIIGDVTLDISRHDKETDEEKLKSKTSKLRAQKPKTKVRSQQEYQKIKDERYQERQVKKVQDNSWEKHWEKNPDGKKAPALGGNRRPKFFDTDKAIEATNAELEARKIREKFRKKSDDFKEKESESSNTNNKDFKKFRGE